MKTYSIYNLETGVIRMNITSDDQRMLEVNTKEGEGWIEGAISALNCLVIDGVVEQRPEIAESKTYRLLPGEELTVSGIPAGTELHHPDGSCVIDDGELVWSSLEPGVTDLVMLNGHYKPCRIKVEVFNEASA